MTRLQTGDAAPAFDTVDENGQNVSLQDFLGRRVVLYFYPKDNTSGCTTQACGFRDAYSDVESKNAVVLGVSPDSSSSHARFKEKHSLPFPLLVDADHSIAEAYGVWGEKSMYGKKYMGIIRSQFVIDEQGVVLDAQYKISPKVSPKKALDAL